MIRSAGRGAARALFAFHARAGARAALRTGTIGVAALVFAVGSAPDPAYVLMTFVRALAARGLPHDGGGFGARLLFAALAGALSAVGARRVTLGATGWMRSLPASGRTARRAAWAAAGLAALPAAGFAAVAPGLAVWLYHAPLDGAKVVGLPVLLAAAAAVTLRVERPAARLLAGAALVAAARGTWPALAGAVLTLAGWDRWAGGLAPPVAVRGRPAWARGGRGTARAARPAGRAAALALAARLAGRAVGWQAWAGALLAAVPPVAFAALVRANNADLAPGTRAWVARLGVGLGVTAWVACGAAALLARRPPWPWVRALPWSSGERVAVDALLLGLPAAGGGVVAAGTLAALGRGTMPTAVFAGAVAADAAVAVAVAAVAAAAGAGAVRAGAGRHTGAAGELALVAVPTVVALALRPAFALVAPLAAAALGALAARRERRAAGAVRWDELRHDVAGDVGWIARV